MNPRRVTARNYRTFQRLELDLPAGVVAIVGSNGAGKSSVANLTDLALFGPDGRSWAPYLTQGSEETELEIELTFEHGGELYRVRRGYSGRGSGKTTLDLEKRIGDDEVVVDAGTMRATADIGWKPQTLADQRATQSAIEELLGMTRETFRASSMLVQGDGAAFTEAKPAERKQILGRILGLDRYARLQEAVKADRRAGEDRLQRIAGELEAADRELVTEDGGDRIAVGEAALSTAGATLAEVGLLEEQAARDLEALAREAAAGEEAGRRRAEALAYAVELQGRLDPLERRLAEAAEAEAAIAVAEDEAAALTTAAQMDALVEREREIAGILEAHRREVIARDEAIRTRELREREKAAITAQAVAARHRVIDLDESIRHVESGDLDSCPTCKQALGADARLATVSSLRAQADQIASDAQAIEERAAAIELAEIPPAAEIPVVDGQRVDVALQEARRTIEAAREAELQRERLAGRLQILREKVAARPTSEELAAARAALGQARAELEKIEAPDEAALDVVRGNALAAKARVDAAAGQRHELEMARAKIETGLERLRELRDRTAAARAERETIQADLDDLAILERAYGRDGIPALIVARVAIPSIEAEACRILADLGTSYRVELRTEKALAGGGTADALDVVISTEDGERPYETFSGGERTRINLALRIALARLLAHRRGAESRLLVIDEPEYLDQAGTAALANVLRGLTGDFARIYLISHVPELRDALDASIEVSRGADGYSTIGGLV